jgi:hypothetical protein
VTTKGGDLLERQPGWRARRRSREGQAVAKRPGPFQQRLDVTLSDADSDVETLLARARELRDGLTFR